jgi:NAD(P)-dependent dehydrogenase (short-subunit alcohol dehydrogenase family)
VVNNAGIFRADAFPAVEPDNVEQQLAVHVVGAFRVTRAAWPHLVRSGRGRVVMTSSSGALGSATLAAYGTAKAGVLGLARSLAMAGRPDGVKVNVVAPMAMSRMMQAGMKNGPAAAALADDRDPQYVAPLVAILCHDVCPTSGETFNAGMRRFSRFVIAESDGYVHPSADVSPEEVLGHWAQVMDVSDFRVVTDTMSWSERHFALVAGHPDSA